MQSKREGIRLGYVALLAAIGWFALGLQVYLVVIQARATGVSVLSAEERVFSFFTILTNLLVALVMTAEAARPKWAAARFLTRSTVQGAVTVYIIVVGVVYNLLLRKVWNPEGWQKVADEIFHDLVPVAFVIYWLAWTPKGSTSWKDPLRWLVYPLAYALYTLMRGIVTQSYPYPFLNVVHLGYPRVLLNMLILTIAILCLSCVIVGIDRWLGRLGEQRPS